MADGKSLPRLQQIIAMRVRMGDKLFSDRTIFLMRFIATKILNASFSVVNYCRPRFGGFGIICDCLNHR